MIFLAIVLVGLWLAANCTLTFYVWDWLCDQLAFPLYFGAAILWLAIQIGCNVELVSYIG